MSKEPGALAKGIALLIPAEGTEEQAAKAAQVVMDVAPIAAQALMEATIRQHGASPAQTLNNMHIEQAIKEHDE